MWARFATKLTLMYVAKHLVLSLLLLQEATSNYPRQRVVQGDQGLLPGGRRQHGTAAGCGPRQAHHTQLVSSVTLMGPRDVENQVGHKVPAESRAAPDWQLAPLLRGLLLTLFV